MAIQYHNFTKNNTASYKSYNIFEEETEIGSASGGLYRDNVFMAVINIFPEFQGKGIGFNVFETIFNEINEVEKISTIRGVWCVANEYNHCENGMSTNLNEFQKQRQTKSDLESVFLTPTGKWAKRLGFNNANIIRNNAEEVTVDFTR